MSKGFSPELYFSHLTVQKRSYGSLNRDEVITKPRDVGKDSGRRARAQLTAQRGGEKGLNAARLT